MKIVSQSAKRKSPSDGRTGCSLSQPEIDDRQSDDLSTDVNPPFFANVLTLSGISRAFHRPTRMLLYAT